MALPRAAPPDGPSEDGLSRAIPNRRSRCGRWRLASSPPIALPPGRRPTSRGHPPSAESTWLSRVELGAASGESVRFPGFLAGYVQAEADAAHGEDEAQVMGPPVSQLGRVWETLTSRALVGLLVPARHPGAGDGFRSVPGMDVPHQGPALVLRFVHPGQDVVQRPDGVQDVGAVVEHHALGALSCCSVSDLGTGGLPGLGEALQHLPGGRPLRDQVTCAPATPRRGDDALGGRGRAPVAVGAGPSGSRRRRQSAMPSVWPRRCSSKKATMRRRASVAEGSW